MGAGDRVSGPVSMKLCKFFGEISYPLYITHYPLIYVYTAWVTRNKIPAAQGAVWGVVLLLTAVTIAYACLKLYDEPVREWLRRRFLVKSVLD
jgi:peptidoglycan/LPS O-acetylase OafA/YrhL